MTLAELTSWAIDRVQVTRCERRGTLYVKTRRSFSGPFIALGNLYMRWSNARISMFVDPARWLAYEGSRLRLAHPALSHWVEPPRSLALEAMPGETLRSLAQRGALDARALRATGRELRRCHALEHGTFAHGDPHLGNVLFDAGADRARLIDFETPYLESVPVPLRRANDLLVVAQELLSYAPEVAWPAWPLALLEGYDDAEIVSVFSGELHIPAGLGRVLWASRTGRKPRAFVEARLASLRAALG